MQDQHSFIRQDPIPNSSSRRYSTANEIWCALVLAGQTDEGGASHCREEFVTTGSAGPWAEHYPAGIDWAAPIGRRPLHDYIQTAATKYADRPAIDFLDRKTFAQKYHRQWDLHVNNTLGTSAYMI